MDVEEEEQPHHEPMMPPAPSGVFTGSHFMTKAHIMPGLAQIQKADPNNIPPFTAPMMAPAAPSPAPQPSADRDFCRLCPRSSAK